MSAKGGRERFLGCAMCGAHRRGDGEGHCNGAVSLAPRWRPARMLAEMSERGFLRVSEIFESFQGEGASAGLPAVFVRLANCNLRCTWCDTRYTWDWAAYDYDSEVRRVA